MLFSFLKPMKTLTALACTRAEGEKEVTLYLVGCTYDLEVISLKGF